MSNSERPDQGPDGAAAQDPENEGAGIARSRKLARKWLARLSLATLLSIFCVIAAGVGVRHYLAATRQRSAFHGLAGDMGQRLSEIESDLRTIRARPAGAERSGLIHWAEECDEELAELDRLFGQGLGRQPIYEETLAAWGEVVTALNVVAAATSDTRDGGEKLEHAAVELTVFREQYGELTAAVRAHISDRERRARYWLYATIGVAAVIGLMCAWTAASIVTEGLAADTDLSSLARALSDISGSRSFQARMAHLCRKNGLPEPSEDWAVSLARVISVKQTHVCFEATARSGGMTVRLWGRRYHWAGWMRSLSRVVFPMYGTATRRALGLLKSHGLPAPELLYHERYHKGPFRAGSLILSEHVGDLEPFKQFADAGFCLLSESARRTMLRRLARFVVGFQDAGIYHVSPRYIHGRNYDHPEGKAEFYLCDLDKVLIWEGCPSLLARRMRRRDRKRLLRRLRLSLGQDDLATLRRFLSEQDS